MSFIAGIRGKSPSTYGTRGGVTNGGLPGPMFANIAAIEAINTTGLENGTVAVPATLLQPFYLELTPPANVVVDGITVVQPTTGPGLWLRASTPVPQWTNQFTWYVDTGVGNNENPGTSAGVGGPLNTIAEVCRRMATALVPPTAAVSPNTVTGYVVNVNGAVAATDSWDWNPRIVDASGVAVATPQPPTCFVTVQATLPTPTITGTAGAATAGTTIASNTQAILGGATTAGAVPGNIVQMTSGTFINYQARVLKASGGDARVGNWWLPGTAPYSGNGTIAGATLGPTSGDSYEVLPLVSFAGAIRCTNNHGRLLQVFKNFSFTSAAVISVQGASFEPLSCEFLCKLSAQTNDGGAENATLRYFGCALVPADNAVMCFDERLRLIASDVINATVSVFNTGRLEIINAVIQGGAVGGGIVAGRGYVGFTGDTSQNGGQLALFNSGSTYGLGIFDTPAANAGVTNTDGNALGVFRNATMSVDAPLYGTSAIAATIGTNVDEGGTVIVRTGITPSLTVTGGGVELQLASDATAIPALVGGSAVPAPAALTTWALWVSNFTRNVVALQAPMNGSKIINAANPD